MTRRRFVPRTLRTRLALFAALAAFGCLTLAGVVVYLAAARLLGQSAEAQLRQVASVAEPVQVLANPTMLESVCTTLSQPSSGASGVPRIGPALGADQTDVVVELIRPDGTACPALGDTGIHQVAAPAWWMRRMLGTDLPQARGDHGERLLVLDEPLAGGWRLRIARDLSRDFHVVYALRGVMLGLAVVGGLAALGFGWVIARGGLRPVVALAETAEHIARTQDLAVRIEVPDRGDSDEVTRLARAFDRMTSALAASRERQAQLVADAGHELRTPLTSLRTNIDLLLRAERSGRSLPAGQRESLFEDVRSQLEELSLLAAELTVLAQDEPARPLRAVRLDEIVTEAVQRVRPRAGERTLDVEVEPWQLDSADAAGLQRALVNVLDNAVKFSPPASTVRVRLDAGTVTVDDEGPGVPDRHRREVFARFWRGDDARSLPGSGLGLAIVADTVGRHRGQVALAEAPGGGTRVRLFLPGHPVADPDPAPAPHTPGPPDVLQP
jgi:two-component system, OmpR family, sensor histidine kinase MprB